MITVEAINALAAERKRIRSGLERIAREVYKIRYAEELPAGFRLDSYMLTNFDGTHYCGMDDEDWEIGTPLVAVTLYYPSWEDHRNVTFPQSWLTQDWKQLETDRVTAIREASRIKSEEEHREAEIAREASERRTYERLKEKFGD